uniref:Uncharacterized protein n=2 Tax=Clastoptera arizonana TaxID=38151 RepID=A0A1B6DA75_9HEMI
MYNKSENNNLSVLKKSCELKNRNPLNIYLPNKPVGVKTKITIKKIKTEEKKSDDKFKVKSQVSSTQCNTLKKIHPEVLQEDSTLPPNFNYSQQSQDYEFNLNDYETMLLRIIADLIPDVYDTTLLRKHKEIQILNGLIIKPEINIKDENVIVVNSGLAENDGILLNIPAEFLKYNVDSIENNDFKHNILKPFILVVGRSLIKISICNKSNCDFKMKQEKIQTEEKQKLKKYNITQNDYNILSSKERIGNGDTNKALNNFQNTFLSNENPVNTMETQFLRRNKIKRNYNKIKNVKLKPGLNNITNHINYDRNYIQERLIKFYKLQNIKNNVKTKAIYNGSSSKLATYNNHNKFTIKLFPNKEKVCLLEKEDTKEKREDTKEVLFCQNLISTTIKANSLINFNKKEGYKIKNRLSLRNNQLLAYKKNFNRIYALKSNTNKLHNEGESEKKFQDVGTMTETKDKSLVTKKIQVKRSKPGTLATRQRNVLFKTNSKMNGDIPLNYLKTIKYLLHEINNLKSEIKLKNKKLNEDSEKGRKEHNLKQIFKFDEIKSTKQPINNIMGKFNGLVNNNKPVLEPMLSEPKDILQNELISFNMMCIEKKLPLKSSSSNVKNSSYDTSDKKKYFNQGKNIRKHKNFIV